MYQKRTFSKKTVLDFNNGLLESIEAEKIERNGYTFTAACEIEIQQTPIRELKGIKLYNFGDVEVTLVGKMQTASYKLKFLAFDKSSRIQGALIVHI